MTDKPPTEDGKFIPTSFESFDKFQEQLVVQGTWYHPENQGRARKKEVGSFSLHPADGGPRKSTDRAGLSLLDGSAIVASASIRLCCPIRPFLPNIWEKRPLIKNNLVVQIHPDTARAISLREGDRVEIKSVKAKIKARIHIFEGARPDCVFVPLGMGHTAMTPRSRTKGTILIPCWIPGRIP